MKKFVIQNRKIFVAACIAVMLCVVTVLHFAEPQDEQIPKLKLPVVENTVTANTRVSIVDTAESEIDSASQSLTVYRLKPVNLNQEKKKIGDLFRISAAIHCLMELQLELMRKPADGFIKRQSTLMQRKAHCRTPMPSKSLSSLLQTTICTQCRNWATLRLVRPQPGMQHKGQKKSSEKMCISTLRLPANLYMEHFVSAFPYPGAEKSLVLTSLQMNIPWLMLMSKARTIVR